MVSNTSHDAANKVLFLLHCLWESEMVSANRVAAINPPIDDTDPIRKFSIDSGSHTDWQNPAEFSPKGKPIRNFSIDPTSSIRTSIADAIFADAISETSIVLSNRPFLSPGFI